MQNQNPCRVIVLGPTGPQMTLRSDAEREVVRAESPLDVVGEIAGAAAGGDGAETVVVVAASTPGLANGELERWSAALREASPGVRIVRFGVGDPETSVFFDAEVGAGDELERFIRDGGVAPASVEEEAAPQISNHVPSGSVGDTGGRGGSDTDVKITGERDASATGVEHLGGRVTGAAGVERSGGRVAGATGASEVSGDGVLVEAMLRGADVLDAALMLMRDRLGVGRVELRPLGYGGVEVRWREQVFGELHAPGADPVLLSEQAGWLAGWLRLSRQQHELREAAFTDSLTGAYNRRYFDRFFPAAIESARKNRRAVTLLVFDVDEFKTYNGRYGHSAGDEILIEMVRLMRSVIRPEDKVCRIGGDEFAVIFHEPEGPRQPGSRPPESVFDISRRFQEQIAAHRFPKLAEEAPGRLTISGGLASYPWDGMTAEALLQQADELALKSKRSGKNAITLGPGAERVCMPEQ